MGLQMFKTEELCFLAPAVEIYEGQVVGQNARSNDIRVNVCKEKALSNMRSKGEGKIEYFKIPKTMGLEDALRIYWRR